MYLYDAIEALADALYPSTITRIVKTPECYVVCACSPDGYPFMQPPYSLSLDCEKVGFYSLNSDESKDAFHNGEELYADYSVLKHMPVGRTDGGPGSGNHGHKGVPGQVGGSAPSESSGKSAGTSGENLTYKSLVPENSYTKTSAEYKNALDAYRTAIRKGDEAKDKYMAAKNAMKSESKPKPESEWDDNDIFEDLIGHRPMIYTEKGKQLKAEYDKYFKESMDYSHEMTVAGDKLREIKQKEHDKQSKDIHLEHTKDATSNDYEGFTTKTTGTSYYDDYLNGEKNGGHIAEMSPKEYLQRCAYQIFDSATIESTIAALDDKNVKKYAEQMKSGTKFDMPYLNFMSGQQEGRHRAAAAMQAGIKKIPVLVVGERFAKYDGGAGSGNFGHEGRPGQVGGSAASHNFGGLKNSELSSKMTSVFDDAKNGTHFSVKMNGVAGKDSYEIYKVSDGFYVRSKNGGNSTVKSVDKLVENCGVYVTNLTSDKVMYKEANIEVGEPETEEAQSFTGAYESCRKERERLASGNYKITEVDDATAKKYADTLNKASKAKIAKLAMNDPQFKAVVDNISAYTQGEYVYQRKATEKFISNGYDPSNDAILGDRLTDSLYLCKDMYKGQNLSVSSASVTEGMANLTKAVNCSDPFDGELYRVAQDRSLMKTADSGNQGVYTPPKPGETISIVAPTSFSKDKAAIYKIAKDKSGDIIYYTVQPGAHAVDVSKLSPYKQAELLTCGEYEVVSVDSKPQRVVMTQTDRFTSETIDSLKANRGATVDDGFVKFPILETHVTLRQKEPIHMDSCDDNIHRYRPDDFSERMVYDDEIDFDGGLGSGNFNHEGRPGEVGGSAPKGSADSTASVQKLSKLKDGFSNLTKKQQFAFLKKTGSISVSDLYTLETKINSGDNSVAEDLKMYSKSYFDNVESSKTVKSLDCDTRNKVSAMSRDDARAWIDKSVHRNFNESEMWWVNWSSNAQKVAIDLGMNETPQVVSKEDFNKYVEESGAAVCYRGVRYAGSMSGSNMIYQMAYDKQKNYFGNGIYGDGLYFSTDRSVADSYSDGSGAVAKCAIRPDAKVVEFKSADIENARRKYGTSDYAIAAMCSGYDAIKVHVSGSEDYYVVLNRAAMVMEDPVDSLANMAIAASERNAAKKSSS